MQKDKEQDSVPPAEAEADDNTENGNAEPVTLRNLVVLCSCLCVALSCAGAELLAALAGIGAIGGSVIGVLIDDRPRERVIFFLIIALGLLVGLGPLLLIRA